MTNSCLERHSGGPDSGRPDNGKSITEVIIMTGASSGIGRAIAERILQIDGKVRIINLGRSDREAVLEKLTREGSASSFTKIRGGNRIHFVEATDFSDEDCAKAKVDKLIECIREKAKLIGVIHCAGAAEVCDDYERADAETRARVDSMRRVNQRFPVNLAIQLMKADLLDKNTPFMYLSSLGAYPGRVGVPGLGEYAHTKKEAQIALKELFQRDEIPLCMVYPGIYDTDMVFSSVNAREADEQPDGIIYDPRIGLEFFGIAAANALPDDGLMKKVAREIFKGRKAAREIARPIIPAWYVRRFNTEKGRKMALPWFVKLFGKQVLEAIRQSEQDHNERVAFHSDNASYGIDFPYAKITFKKLWPAWISKFITRIGRKFGLV